MLFGHRDTTILALIVLVGLAAGVAVLRVAFGRRPGRAQVGLPALMSWARSSPLAFVRHGAVLLSLAGVPFFMLALADPYTRLRQQEVTFPGRRIALLIDASASMVIPFQAARLNAKGPNQASFFTTIGAAETFIRQRMKGRYRDLIALVEFGDEAYVVTPFTNDYDNILLSLSLIGDWTEYMKFSDQGTTIGKAIDAGRRAVPRVRFPGRLGQRDDHLQRRPGSPGDRRGHARSRRSSPARRGPRCPSI